MGNLKIHIGSAHEKIKYPCNLCEHIDTIQCSLKKHIESVHKKIIHTLPSPTMKFWFFLLKSYHMKFRLQCFYKNFITKRTEILKYVLVQFWTWSDGECRCGRVVSCHEWKHWLVPRSDLVDHLTSPHREGSVPVG